MLAPYRRRPAPRRYRRKSKFQKLKNKVNRIGMPEVKALTTKVLPTSIGPLGSIVNFNLISNGSGAGDRIGDIITNKDLHGYVTFVKGPANVDLDTFVRCIIFRDLAHNGTAPAVTEILNSVDYDSPFSNVSKPRYSVLKDWMFHLGTSRLGQENAPTARSRKINVKLGQKVYYQGTTNTEPSIEKGPVYMLMLSSPVSVAGTEPEYNINAQIRFTDA